VKPRKIVKFEISDGCCDGTVFLSTQTSVLDGNLKDWCMRFSNMRFPKNGLG